MNDGRLTEREVDQLAQELMDIQSGSAEDAKALLDSAFDYRDRARIEDAIDRIAAQHKADLA